MFDDLEFRGELRTRTIDTLGPEEDPVEEGGFELAGRRLGPGEVARLPRRARHRARRRPRPRPLGRRHRLRRGARGRRRLRPRGVRRRGGAVARGRRRARPPGWPTPRVPRCCTTPRAPTTRWPSHGWRLEGLVSDTALAAYLVQPDQRSYDLSDLTLRYLRRELRTEREPDQDALFEDPAGGQDAAETAMLHARAVIDLAEALDGEVEAAGGTRLLRRGRAAAGPGARGHGARRHRRRHRAPRAARGALRRRGAARGRRRLRRDRQGDQPRLAQAAAGRALRRARHAQDQAHQDRLHHRRRRAPAALRQDRAPVPAPPAAPPGRGPSPPDDRGPAQDGGARRADPHDVQPDDRGDRPALQHRPEPAEHPDPHRGGSPDPRGLRGRPGVRVPDDRRLQPGRDADHGPPLRGRRADRGVPVGPRLPLDHRRAGLRRRPRRRDRRDAGQDQGDELRPRLRAVGLRPGPAAPDRARRGARR